MIHLTYMHPVRNHIRRNDPNVNRKATDDYHKLRKDFPELNITYKEGVSRILIVIRAHSLEEERKLLFLLKLKCDSSTIAVIPDLYTTELMGK